MRFLFTQVSRARAFLFIFLSCSLLVARQELFCLASSDNAEEENAAVSAASAKTRRPVRNLHCPSADLADTRQFKGDTETAKTDACGLLCIAPNVEPDPFKECLNEAFPDTQGDQRQLFWPGSEGWDDALSRSFGPPKHPAAVVYAKATDDVSKAVKCASENGYKVSARGRAHSLQGWGVIDGGLVIDMSGVCYPDEFVVDRNATGPHILPGSKYIATMKAGAGCTNAVMLNAGHTKFEPEERAMVLIGGCPSVGITGYTLGGGMGDITPYVGYGADILVELEMVLYDGTVITASEKENPDLFWASRGGGGGNGIVTSLTYRVVQAPSDRFTQFVFRYIDSKTSMTRLQKYLYDTKSGSAKFGGSIVSTINSGTYVIGIYLGSWEEAMEDMKRFGLLDDELFDKSIPSTLFKDYENTCGGEGSKACSSADGVPPYGAEVSEYGSYAEMEGKVICRTTNIFPTWTERTSNVCEDLGLDSEKYCSESKPPAQFSNNPRPPVEYGFYEFDLKCEKKEVLEALLRKAADPQSFLNLSGTGKFATATLTLTGLLLPPLEDDTIKNIVDAVDFNHFAHGAPLRVESDATAFPWRNAGILTAAVGQEKANILLKDKAFKNDPDNLQGYYNYMSPENPNWRRFYFGENWERLTEVKGQYDPLNVFGKPITVETPLKPVRKTKKTPEKKSLNIFRRFFKKEKAVQADAEF